MKEFYNKPTVQGISLVFGVTDTTSGYIDTLSFNDKTFRVDVARSGIKQVRESLAEKRRTREKMTISMARRRRGEEGCIQIYGERRQKRRKRKQSGKKRTRENTTIGMARRRRGEEGCIAICTDESVCTHYLLHNSYYLQSFPRDIML